MKRGTAVIGGATYLVGPAAVAAHFDVSVNQVCIWQKRRARNGFPRDIPGLVNGVERRLFDPEELDEWRRNYVPSTGGRAPGPNSRYVNGRRPR